MSETTYYGRPCRRGHGAAEGRQLRQRANRACVECQRSPRPRSHPLLQRIYDNQYRIRQRQEIE